VINVPMSSPERPVVLIVDGDEPTRSLFSDALTRAEFDVLTAADGASALAIAFDRPVGMVLLDNHMHGMIGTQVIQRLRARASTRSLPVILVTRTANDVLDPIAGLDLGSSDFLVKPVDLVELVARVKARVRLKGDEDRARRIVETTTDAFVSFNEDDVEAHTALPYSLRNGQLTVGEMCKKGLKDVRPRADNPLENARPKACRLVLVVVADVET
jgi:DNA-binding response OmpR family regulator